MQIPFQNTLSGLHPVQRRRLQALAAVTPAVFLMVLISVRLLYDAPFLRTGTWSVGVCLLAAAIVLFAFAAVSRDVSGRTRAERALRRNEERLRQVIRVSHIGIFDHDHRTGEVYWSPEQREMFGCGPDEKVTFPDLPPTWNQIHPDDRDRVAKAVERAHESEEGPFDIEYRLLRRDGNERWVSNRSKTFFEGEGPARHPVRTVGAIEDISERKRAERQLKLTQAAVDQASVGVFWLNSKGQVTYANDCACKSLGLSLQDLIGQHVWDFDPDFASEAWADAWTRIKQVKRMQSQTRHRRKDGTIFPVETVGTHFVFEGEEHIFVFAQDITERERAEEALAMFRHSIDRASDPIFWLNPSGGFGYVNDEACRSLGYSREELLQLHLWDIETIYPKEKWFSQWEVWENAGRDSVEYVAGTQRRKDGTLIPVEVVAQHIWSPDGHSLHVAYVRNITERKRAEQALRISEERLRQVALVYDIGVFDYDHLTDTRYWSAELRKHVGLTLSEPVDRSKFEAVVPPDDRERVVAAARRGFDPRGDGHFEVQHRILTAQGGVRWLESRSQTFFAGEGSDRHAVRTVGATVDITARIEAEKTLKESLHEKEILLREVHHRVKNNLQIIASLLHFQAKKGKDPEELAALFEARDRLRSMILVHEKLYQSQGLTRIDFGNYLQSLAAELQRSHGARSARRVQVRVSADKFTLPIESALPCGMIVCELLTNVFKYAFPGNRSGNAQIRLTTADSQVRLIVSDDGVGLPPDFDPQQSTSFGWQLIQNLTAQLGGTLHVVSLNGTTVSICFPMQSVGHRSANAIRMS